MKQLICLLVTLFFAASVLQAQPRSDADIVVMTQNQYLGADLTPIVTADSPAAYAQAAVGALQSIAANRFPDRAQAMAAQMADRRPHLIALQEVFAFDCIDFGSGQCALFTGALNDHLEETMSALAGLGADYYVAGIVENLTIPAAGFPLPGLPVFLDGDATPDVFITVLDRDVILARSDVDTAVVDFICPKPSADGCNFTSIANASALGIPIPIERGFVAVDATIDGQSYRFVNTHLEVQFPDSGNPASQVLQALQASELSGQLAAAPMPAGSRLLVAGDINSSEDDARVGAPIFPFLMHPPYLQFTGGTDFLGNPLFAPLADVWPLRPGKPPGDTCCQLADLTNVESIHDERVDVILARPVPARVKANVLGADTDDKTDLGLWPSDHASVVSELVYD